MRILLITAYFPPEIGSAAHLFYELGVALTKEGHKVTVLTGFPNYNVQGNLDYYNKKLKWIMREEVNGIHVIRMAIPRFSRHILIARALWQFFCAFTFTIGALILPSQDVSLVYSPPLPLGITSWVLRKFKGTPYILNVQDLFPQSVIDLGIMNNRLIINFFEKMEKWVYNKADFITVHSSGNRDHILSKGVYSHKVKVIPNCVDTDFISEGDRLNDFRIEYKLGDKFIVSFAGTLGYSQDIDIILEAAKYLKEHKDILFLIVGDGVEKNSLKRKASQMSLSNVRFIPMQSRDKYPSILQASDICLATLRKKVNTPVVPSKIISIMAAGKPVIACMDMRGDAPKLINNAKCGIVLPPENARLLSENILKLFQNREIRERLGYNGRKYAEQHLSLNVYVQHYIRLFNKLVSKNNK